MNDTQKKMLLRLAAWAVKTEEAKGESFSEDWGLRAMTADRAACVARYELEQAIEALTSEEVQALREGLDTLAIGKAHLRRLCAAPCACEAGCDKACGIELDDQGNCSQPERHQWEGGAR